MKIINVDVENLKINYKGSRKKFCYFTYEDKNVSESILLSPLMEGFIVEYGKNKEYLNYYLLNEDEKYGTVEKVVFEDKKNITYKEENCKKTVHIYKPYDFNDEKECGVIYMFDSDNLFDINKVGSYTSSPDDYGSWQVETTLAAFKKKYGFDFIIVGISSKEGYRDKELTPHLSYQQFRKEFKDDLENAFSDGKLDELGNFIKETLFKYVDEHYKVDKRYVGICGASSGGLAAHYLSLRDIGLYTFSFVFSPASALFTDETWWEFYDEIDLKSKTKKAPFILFYQGGYDELEGLLYQGNQNFYKNLERYNYDESKYERYVNVDFRHNEIAWRLAFNYAINSCYVRLSKK